MRFKKYLNYNVYEDGRVYSFYINKFLKGDITKHGYIQYTLYDNKKSFKIKAHRLVGMLFLKCPKNYKNMVINHIDGDKLNNHYSNLEWTTVLENNIHARKTGLNNISKSNRKRWENKEWACKVAKNISTSLLNLECNKGKNNGRFKYEIYDKDGNEYSRKNLSKLINKSQSYTDSLIKKLANNININNKDILKYGIYVIDIRKS